MFFLILFLDRNRSVEQKVACVLIQRMFKSYSRKSAINVRVLQMVNIIAGLAYASC